MQRQAAASATPPERPSPASAPCRNPPSLTSGRGPSIPTKYRLEAAVVGFVVSSRRPTRGPPGSSKGGTSRPLAASPVAAARGRHYRACTCSPSTIWRSGWRGVNVAPARQQRCRDPSERGGLGQNGASSTDEPVYPDGAGQCGLDWRQRGGRRPPLATRVPRPRAPATATAATRTAMTAMSAVWRGQAKARARTVDEPGVLSPSSSHEAAARRRLARRRAARRRQRRYALRCTAMACGRRAPWVPGFFRRTSILPLAHAGCCCRSVVSV